MNTSSPTSRVLTLVFTDLADSTALKTAHGDAAVGDLISRHRDHVTQLAERCAGRIIDWAGDGCFLTFETSSAAVMFALRLQQVHHYESDLPGVRVGIHMGEVSEKAHDGTVRIEGLAVDLSARIGGLATPGQVLISGPVQQSAKQRLSIHEFGQPIRWETYGTYALKGFDEPLDIREAGLQDISPFEAPKASEKAWPATSDRGNEVSPKLADSTIRKLAVLPLSNLSGDPGQEYFADGMTEAITTELAKIKPLHVISRTSVMQYRNTTKPMAAVAQELGVDALIEGSVLRAGDEVRITAQLIRGATDEHLWADSYDGTIASVLKLQKEVALAIASEINVTLTPAQQSGVGDVPEVNPEAYDLYLQACRKFRKLTPNNLADSRDLLRRAIDLDPAFVQAYATLAYTYWQAGVLGYGDMQENYRKHRWAARAALRIDEHHAGGNAAMGWSNFSSEYDWAEAEFRFQRAIAQDPNEISAYIGLAYLNAALGRKEQSYQYNEEHLRRVPNAQSPYHVAATTRMQLGDFENALANVQRALEFRSDAVVTLIDGVLAAGFVGRMDLADAWAERAASIAGRASHVLSLWASAHGYGGDRDFGERLLAEIEDLTKTQRVLHSDLAYPLSALGHHERALDAMERAVDAQEHYMVWLGVSPLFEDLRSNPRFQALLQKMDFPLAAGHD